ncbi:60S ribosomal protein L7-1, partial [Clarias magur]
MEQDLKWHQVTQQYADGAERRIDVLSDARRWRRWGDAYGQPKCHPPPVSSDLLDLVRGQIRLDTEGSSSSS